MKNILKNIILLVFPERSLPIISSVLRNWKLFPLIVLMWIKHRLSQKSVFIGKKGTNVKLSFAEIYLFVIEGWYHDFEALGLKTGVLHPNQRSKQSNIFSLVDQAVSLCHEQVKDIGGIELFCADGYYSNYAIEKGVKKMHGIDKDSFYIAKARLITKILGNSENITFDCRDVFQLYDTYDFCICAGGLYHISNPCELLHLLAEKIRYAMVIQTVYSLADESPDYFESPAPGWTWGCRFSYRYFLNMVKDSGWSIVSVTTNQLLGNNRLEDRGSVYLLCVPEHVRNI